MSNKSEQINLRISTELKTKLSEMSDNKGISVSKFIRHNLEATVEGKTNIEKRITSIEEKFAGEKLIRRMMYAAANISSIDTGFPLDKCLSIAIQTLEGENIQKINVTNTTRAEMETIYLNVQEKIKKKLKLSDHAIAFISVLFNTFMGIIYDEHIFDISPMSILTLERLREELNQGKDKKI